MKVKLKGGAIVNAEDNRYIWLKSRQQLLRWDTLFMIYPDIRKNILEELNIKYDKNIKVAYSNFKGKTDIETKNNLITFCNKIKTIMKNKIYNIDDIEEIDNHILILNDDIEEIDNHILILNKENFE